MQVKDKSNLYKHLAEHFALPLAYLEHVGTHILEDSSRETDASQVIWTLVESVIIRTHPSYVAQFETLIQENQPLSVSEIAQNLTVKVLEQDNFYTVTSEDFKPVGCDYVIRTLNENDKSAFDAFQAQCSERDKEYGEVSLGDEVIIGAFDGEGIIAVASSYEWHGFVDFGVLTDPHYRGQGVGKAVSSSVTQYYLDKDEQRPLLWRHETSNLGSGKIAKSLGWQHFATLDYIRFQEVNHDR